MGGSRRGTLGHKDGNPVQSIAPMTMAHATHPGGAGAGSFLPLMGLSLQLARSRIKFLLLPPEVMHISV